MDQFDLRFESKAAPDDVLRDCLAIWTGQLSEHGYTLLSQSDLGISYRRRYWRWYVIALAAALFPIGLLFLLSKVDATITATAEPNGSGSVLSISGLAPKNVIEAFERLEI